MPFSDVLENLGGPFSITAWQYICAQSTVNIKMLFSVWCRLDHRPNLSRFTGLLYLSLSLQCVSLPCWLRISCRCGSSALLFNVLAFYHVLSDRLNCLWSLSWKRSLPSLVPCSCSGLITFVSFWITAWFLSWAVCTQCCVCATSG